MNSQLRKLLAASGVSVFCLVGMTAARAADLTVRIAWYMPPHTATADQGQAFADAVTKLSHGKIKVETYPSGSLLKESNIAQGLSNNTVNAAIFGMHWWSKYEPALEWDTVPFLADDAGALLNALHGKLGQDVNTLLNKHNVEVIGWGFYGYAESYVNTKRAIKTPTDLKGLKMRSEGKLSAKFLAAQGATPVAVDSSEVYTSLQSGSLDGAVSGLSSIVSRKWYEVGHYITAIHYVPLVYPIQVNAKWWKGLTQAQRDIIAKAAVGTESQAVADIEKEFNDDIALSKKHGNEVYRPTDAELQQWKDTAGVQARKDYIAEVGAPGQQILSDVDAALKK
ncbi:MAG TPA: TRAP transporter substrate-binding protein [Castellaniella sp.]|uniref:TRAP transporter substrate-binding protein n=1 Tax=Castellaniella sp. TaxID=1955812 RepID=UPI002EFCD0FA